jgi:hypothetical protein
LHLLFTDATFLFFSTGGNFAIVKNKEGKYIGRIDINLNQLLDNIDTHAFRQVDFAKLFIWFLTDIQDMSECLMSDIIRCFKDSNAFSN